MFFFNWMYRNIVVSSKLNNTPLKKIEPSAFVDAKSLVILHLENTLISELPTGGLSFLEELYLQNVPTLEIFPSVLTLLQMKIARLTYPSHCCAFSNPEKQYPLEYLKFKEEIMRNCSSTTTSLPSTMSTTFAPLMNFMHRTKRQLIHMSNSHYGILKFRNRKLQVKHRDKRQGDYDKNEQWLSEPKDIDPEYIQTVHCGEIYNFKSVNCTPQPDALNPCEGVMGYNWLRVVVWFVLSMAVVGNFIVIVVSLCSHHKMTVSKFLMCNLAFSDFTLGSYLLILAIVDVRTIGDYFNYAIHWQYRGGCQVGGFMAVFSQSLSIFTLTVITLERWYAISHAIHLTKRLRIRQAYFIMTCGWAFAIITAMLPILSISSYSEVSICLPMKAKSFVDKFYLFFLLTFNMFAFIIILISYIDMFWKVYVNATTARSNDATIAKRMSILVFTDFACLFPSCFFGITAVAGVPLISVTQSKILLVLFYPLNSCANPFLYAIFTKQFKKDLFGILSKHGFCQQQAMKYRGITYTSNPYSGSQSRNNSLPMSNVNNIMLRTSDGSMLTQLTLDHNGPKRSISGTGNSQNTHTDVAGSSCKKSQSLEFLRCTGNKSRKRSVASISSIQKPVRNDLISNKKRRLPFIHRGNTSKKSKGQRNKGKTVSNLVDQITTIPKQRKRKCEVCQQECCVGEEDNLSFISTRYFDLKIPDAVMPGGVTDMGHKHEVLKSVPCVKDTRVSVKKLPGNKLRDQPLHEDIKCCEKQNHNRNKLCASSVEPQNHCGVEKKCNDDENVNEQNTLLVVRDEVM